VQVLWAVVRHIVPFLLELILVHVTVLGKHNAFFIFELSVTFSGSVPVFLGRVVYLLNWIRGSPVDSTSH